MTVTELEQRFGIAGVAAISAGQGGLPRIAITTPAASAEIYLHGAHVTSFQPAGSAEVLFVSTQSSWEDGKAIRGGIPVCFPWFRNKLDDPKAPSHGVVRTKTWTLDAITYDGQVATVSLSTASDAGTRAWWPYDYHLTHRVHIGKSLVQELVMHNTGSVPLRFEEALHTYFRVGGAEHVVLSGLSGVTYLDNTDGNQAKVQEGDVVFIKQTDRAYMETTHALEIFDPVLRRRIRLGKEDSRSTVVWNPWSTGAAALKDMGDDEWRSMTCVEASNMRACGVDLGPGQQHVMKTTIAVT
jgi:glucose-6-phosphate 1-epimerase